MSHSMKTVWLPGLLSLFLSTFVLLILTRLIPAETWVSPKALLLIGFPWTLSYLVFGALGAYLSRRAGGTSTERFLAGTFPLALHFIVFTLPVISALISPIPRFPEHLMLSFLVQAGVLWLAVPGILLTLGTLPFLRQTNRH